MKRMLSIAMLAVTTVAHAQTAGFTLQQVRFMDSRYWRTTNAFDAGLTTSTVFGASGNVSGFYNTLTYTETDPVFGPWLTSFSATNTPGLTTDNETTTNDGTRISVKGYTYVYYQVTNNADWIDFEAGNFRQATWGEMESGPAAVDWGDLE